MKRISFWTMDKALHREFVGMRLSVAIRALGKIPADISREYGIGSNKLTQWRDGTNYPEPRFLAQFAEDYGLTTDYFYRGSKAGVSAALAGDLARAEAAFSEASQASGTR